MEFSVIDKLEFASESRATIVASEWIDRAMETRVHIKMLLLSKTFTAILIRNKLQFAKKQL